MCLNDNEITEIGRLIELSSLQEFPSALLRFIRMLFPIDNIVTLGFAEQADPLELFRDFGIQAGYEFSRRYTQGAYLLDPFYQLSLDKNRSGLFSMKQVAPDRFFQSEYYNSYCCTLPLIDELCFVYPVSNEWSLVYSLARGPQTGFYSDDQIDQLRRLEPVLGPLMVKHWSKSILNRSMNEALQNMNEIALRIFAFAKTQYPKGISRRESEVAALILQGHSSQSISADLEIAVGTVKVLRRRLYRKLEISSQNELYTMFFPTLISSST